MEEKKVTIGNETLTLPSPFVVFATQNPLEHEGTYPLPEAQLDRFLMRIILDYPSKYDEKKILMQEANSKSHPDKGRSPTISMEDSGVGLRDEEQTPLPLLSGGLEPSDLLEMIDYIARSIRVDEKIYDYVGDILSSLRSLTTVSNLSPTSSHLAPLSYGPSTRAGLALIRTSRIRALME